MNTLYLHSEAAQLKKVTVKDCKSSEVSLLIITAIPLASITACT